MINPKQFEQFVIAPACQFLEMDSPSARALMLGTAAQESGLGTYLHQVGGGPAKGVFQMEPNTYNDIWDNFLKYHPEITQRLARRYPIRPPPEAMITDLFLAAVMCRLHYRRVKVALPAPDDIPGLAAYWNNNYNCNPNAGTDAEFIRNWHRCVEGGKA
ncbi:MAG: hypothetical protein HQL99_14240 [Magnetococcales bacterium]|nr:hypothetical protein [Magnetococcales bacterium]